MIEAMTTAHWIASALGAVAGALVVYVLLQFAQRETPAIGQPFETNGEADLTPHQESFADVKDTF